MVNANSKHLILSLVIVLCGCAGKHNIPAGPTMDLVAIKYDVARQLALDYSLHKGAEDGFREVLNLAPRFAEAHYNLAISLAHQSKWHDAMQEFNVALSITPDFDLAKKGQDVAKHAIARGDLPPNMTIPRYCRIFHELYEYGC